MAIKTYSMKRDGNKKISNNFSVCEFACKDGNDKVLIDTDLVQILQKIRDHFLKPIVVNSGYRTRQQVYILYRVPKTAVLPEKSV